MLKSDQPQKNKNQIVLKEEYHQVCSTEKEILQKFVKKIFSYLVGSSKGLQQNTQKGRQQEKQKGKQQNNQLGEQQNKRVKQRVKVPSKRDYSATIECCSRRTRTLLRRTYNVATTRWRCLCPRLRCGDTDNVVQYCI